MSRTAATGAIRFVLDGELVELRDVDPTRTVLQYLREDLGRIGSKEGCAEGDCGACTVALAEIDASGKRLQVRAINSCIQFLPTLDGKELITVESLKPAGAVLHPVQQAMVDWHGSQCGFCTPGFVMSMFALFKNNAEPSRREIDDALAGNLCRCTGYSPIVKAATQMYAESNSGDNRSGWLYESKQDKASKGEADKIALLQKAQSKESLECEYGDRRFFAPRTLDELAGLASRWPDAVLLAGGTDVGLWVTKQHRSLDTVIYTGTVRELGTISTSDRFLEIGAAVTLTDAMDSIVSHYPEMEEMLLRFASPPIRNAGTLGGNIANGSPIGDTMPALLVLDCELLLRSGADSRRVPLNEFYIDYQKTALAAGEFVERVLIPLRDPGWRFDTYKVSKRFDQDISAVCGAYRVTLNGGNVSDVRLAYGGLAAIPKRAHAAESALEGRAWEESSVHEAMTALDRDFAPIDDMRSTAAYRQQVCKNLLYRFWLEAENGKQRVYDYGR